MRRLLLTMILVASGGSAFAGGGQEAAILKVHEQLAEAWNKDDAKGMAAGFADDADLINPLGRVAKGKAEIEKLYQDEHRGVFKGSHFASECKAGVHVVKPDVAIVTCSFEVTGGTLPDGKPMPAMKGIYTATMVKAKNRWQIVAGRPMIPFSPPK